MISRWINGGDVMKLKDAEIYTCNGLMMHTKKVITRYGISFAFEGHYPMRLGAHLAAPDPLAAALLLLAPHRRCRRHSKKTKPPPPPPPPPTPQSADFSALPPELVHKALAAAYASDVAAANHACRDALRPLREVAALHAYGRRVKHGPVMGAATSAAARGCGVSVRHEAERQRTLGLAARLGSAAAMVDAGLMCWEEGRREEAVEYYRSAAGLGHPVGMCNPGVSYLEGIVDLAQRISFLGDMFEVVGERFESLENG